MAVYHDEMKILTRNERAMGIHFDNPIGKPELRQALGSPRGGEGADKKKTADPKSFFSLLNKASEDSGSSATRQDHSNSVLEAKKALELCQRIKLQMNENLLRVMSDTEGEKSNENSLMEGLNKALPGHKKSRPCCQRSDRPRQKAINPKARCPNLSLKKRRISLRASPAAMISTGSSKRPPPAMVSILISSGG